MKHKKLVTLGFLTAVAVALQIFESLIPVPVQIPGGKLGIANIVTLIIVVLYGGREVVAVSLIRSLLGSLMHGGVISGIYSISGALGAALICAILYKYVKQLSLIGIGVLSALTHNLIQVVVAVILMQNIYVFTYYPVLMLISVPSGIVTGLAAGYILKNNVILKIKR